MNIVFKHKGKAFEADLSKPIDISISLDTKEVGPNCFFAPPVNFAPYTSGDFVGSIAKGSPVNFYNIQMNPHGNGTHTECVGHIKEGAFYIKDSLQQYTFVAQLISVYPEKTSTGDRVITKQTLEPFLGNQAVDALIIRTLPNPVSKQRELYSGTNPPYIDPDAMRYIVESLKVKHLLVDIPSVDREEDGGALTAHKIFWNFDNKIRTSSTITELIYVNDEIEDGEYLLQFQILNICLDASPSRPVLYRIKGLEDGDKQDL